MDDLQSLKSAIEDLQARLREEIRQKNELERRCHLLEKLAYRDPSSGLRTETYLHARVTEEIERSIRYPSSTTLLTFAAPEKGEEILFNLGRRLEEELRASDQVFSLSTHGLAVLLVETPEDGAQTVLDRIKGDLEQFMRGYGYTLTSFPVDANLADDFLKLAMDRHNSVARQLNPNAPEASVPQPNQTIH